MHYLGAISKMTEWSQFLSKAKRWTSQVMQVYALTTDAKEAEVNWFHEHLQELLELTSKKKSQNKTEKISFSS